MASLGRTICRHLFARVGGRGELCTNSDPIPARAESENTRFDDRGAGPVFRQLSSEQLGTGLKSDDARVGGRGAGHDRVTLVIPGGVSIVTSKSLLFGHHSFQKGTNIDLLGTGSESRIGGRGDLGTNPGPISTRLNQYRCVPKEENDCS